MRAVIMAGGEGTRLRPISIGRPKPMVTLFDRPVMEHMICLLKKHGIRDITATLQYMPQVIMEYFGDGRRLDVRLDYSVEKEPLGTAGSVKNCGGFEDAEDIFIISGDAVCDFDLTACLEFHKAKNADVTIVMYHHPKPLEYGIVMADKEGRIERFVEKPSWNQVFANTVNTGVYIIKREVMERVPANTAFDFARDLFPLLLKENRGLYGYAAAGYWCDIGDCEAYLNCCTDILTGRASLDFSGLTSFDGIYTDAGRSGRATIIPPCFIGRDVTIGREAVVGPHAIIGAGTHIGERAVIQQTVTENARIGAGATLYGALVCSNAVIKDGAIINEGAVIGENTIVGRDCLVMDRVRIWPNKEVHDNERVGSNIITGSLKSHITFSEQSTIRGELNIDLTPEICTRLGAALDGRDMTGVAFSGGEGARILAEAFKAGRCSAGGGVIAHDAPIESAAVYAASAYALPISVFIVQKGNRIDLSFFDEAGLPLSRERERKIEAVMRSGEVSLADTTQIGHERRISGICDVYRAAATGFTLFKGRYKKHASLSVVNGGIANRIMRETLELLGCEPGRGIYGVPVLEVSGDGRRLSAADEDGATATPDQILALLCLLEFENGGGAVAVPYNAPGTIDIMAESFGASVLRIGRDAGAEELYKKQPYMHDGIFAAARIYARMSGTGETLSELMSRVPHFRTQVREVTLRGDRGSIMRALAESCSGERELFDGLRISSAQGFVHVSPLTSRSALRIIGEAANAEIAAELCDVFERRAKMLDSASRA